MPAWSAIFPLWGFTVITHNIFSTTTNISGDQTQAFLEELNRQYAKDENKLALANWAYQINMTEENLEKQLAVEADVAKNHKKQWKKVKRYPWKNLKNYSLRRQFQMYSVLDAAILPKIKFKRLSKIKSNMETIYATTKICAIGSRPGDNCTLSLDPELTDILATSRNPELLKYVWLKWRDAVGPINRFQYKNYVDLSNEAARRNHFKDYSECWLKDYEDPYFKYKVNRLWEQVKPLYQQLHAYIRTKLRKKYGNIVSQRGPIPAHLLGNMWAQSWSNIADFTLPYPNVQERTDLGEKLQRQGYTVKKIYETAYNFYKSINLTEMPESFWKKSVLVRPTNGGMVCQAGAWDFFDGENFRISHCAKITEKDFITAHHEMGHIEYFLQYKDQPVRFRQGANDGFHEAIGDLITLSVQSSKHLKKIGLHDDAFEDPKVVLNNLFRLGLFQIAYLPFSYLTDLWRWDVFSGKIKFRDYNCKWWQMREKYQGVEPPIARSEDDFDPAAKYHIVGDVPYLRYFVSMVLQYQFHKALCEIAGEYQENNPAKPLHNCDIYGHPEAGNRLKEMLSMGSSRPWPDALQVLTGQREMDASGILEYFRPLHKWLEWENAKNMVFVGWEPSRKVCTRSRFQRMMFG